MEAFIEFLTVHFSDYAIWLILAAAFIDSLVFTGLILYGFLMITMVGVFYTAGLVNEAEIFVVAFLGTYVGNCVNFLIGLKLQETKIVQKILCRPQISTITKRMQSNWLLLWMIPIRIVGFTRPLYAVTFAAFGMPPKKFFLFEFFVAAFWVALWLSILVFGTETYNYFAT